MKNSARSAIAIFAAVMVAACSAANPGLPHTTPGQNARPATTHIVVKFPKHGHRRPPRGARYVSLGTDSVLFTLTQVNGAAPPSGFTLSASVTLGTNCTGTGPYTCSTTWTVPAGSDAFTVGAYDGPGGTGHLLSKNAVTQTIVPGPNTVGVTLQGVPSTFAVSPPTTGTIGVTMNATAFTVSALDADGYTILGTYTTPITLKNGDSTGATTLATSGSDNPPAGELLGSSDVATFAYNGSAISPVTITASGTGATNGTGTFYVDDVLHNFLDNATDGGEGTSEGLLQIGDDIYGTTTLGGSYGQGTVFQVDTSGNETVLHSFHASIGDGDAPLSGLIAVGNEFYGTTLGSGAGMVYQINASGTESIIYSFKGGTSDGGEPEGNLLPIGSELYGTTSVGGPSSDGTIFELSTSGTESVLHSFTGEPSDGKNPGGSLVAIGSELYGTTYNGGTNNEGTVFEINTSGTESLLHSFGGVGDGSEPGPSLLVVGNEIYGTTQYGGANGMGTVFEIDASGNESVLYSFKGGSTDGQLPEGNLVAGGNELYGSTIGGGAKGHGTVFAVSTTGAEKVLHSFNGPPYDATEGASLLLSGTTLYGTTLAGGTGFGTFFSIATQ